jgi:hypothetical protein
MEINRDILPLFSPHSGCDYHRVMLPLAEMGMDLHSLQSKSVEDFIGSVKLIFFNRTPHHMLPKLLELRKKNDFKIVVDIDDYWVLHPKHFMYSAWVKHKTGEQIIECFKVADAVTCTTEILAERVRPYNKNVHVIPNAVPFGHVQFTGKKSISDKTRIIYAGGNSHFWDIQELKVPFQKLNASNLNNYEISLAGYNDHNEPSKRDWDRIEHSFNLGGELKNYRRINTLPLDNYMDVYNDSDVSLAPLENNNFNRYKSNLKIIEAGCKWNPIICSRIDPYTHEKEGAPLMYAGNAREWFESIKYCIQNRSFIMDQGEKLGNYVREHYNLLKVNEYRKQLFEHLIS